MAVVGRANVFLGADTASFTNKINKARRDVMFALQNARLSANERKRFEPTGNEVFYPGASFPWLKPAPK